MTNLTADQWAAIRWATTFIPDYRKEDGTPAWETLQGMLRNKDTSEEREEIDKLRRELEHTREWYATRWEAMFHELKKLPPGVAAPLFGCMANGTVGPVYPEDPEGERPPNYGALLQKEKHRTLLAEEQLREATRKI